MKTVLSYGLKLPQIRANIWFILFYICLTTFLVFLILQIQVKCIKLGYKINNYSKQNRYLSITVQKLELERNKFINKSNLYKKGEILGLTIPDFDNTYYVK